MEVTKDEMAENGKATGSEKCYDIYSINHEKLKCSKNVTLVDTASAAFKNVAGLACMDG